MLFRKRPRGEDVGTIQTLRDVVEIVAIALAGCWAIYVFVYQNRIKPANAPPEITIAAQLIHEGHRKGFEIVDVRTQIKNVGTVPVEYLGFAETLSGSEFLPRAPRMSSGTTQAMDRTPLYSFSRPVVIYQRLFLTSAGDASAKHDLPLDVGQEYDSNTIVYVPAAYSHIVLYASGAYWRPTNAVLPTSIKYTRDGLPRFEVQVPGLEVPTYNAVIAEAEVSSN